MHIAHDSGFQTASLYYDVPFLALPTASNYSEAWVIGTQASVLTKSNRYLVVPMYLVPWLITKLNLDNPNESILQVNDWNYLETNHLQKLQQKYLVKGSENMVWIY